MWHVAGAGNTDDEEVSKRRRVQIGRDMRRGEAASVAMEGEGTLTA
jgi:hypothetical protein